MLLGVSDRQLTGGSILKNSVKFFMFNSSPCFLNFVSIIVAIAVKVMNEIAKGKLSTYAYFSKNSKLNNEIKNNEYLK